MFFYIVRDSAWADAPRLFLSKSLTFCFFELAVMRREVGKRV
jgi:hypothetical protein